MRGTLSVRIGLASLHDPDNPRSWSGSVHHMIASLKARHDVVWLGPMARDAAVRHGWIRVKRRLTRYVPWGWTVTEHDAGLARALARGFDRRAKEEKPDVLFAPAGSIGVGDMRYGAPMVYLSDATFASMVGYYPEFAKLSARTRRDGALLEQKAIDRAAECVFASEWARASAIRDYGADPARVHALPFGANIERAPDPSTLKYTRDDQLRLLLVGIDWMRKGVDIAVEALGVLRARGLPATLTVVGCTPPAGTSAEEPGLTVIPFLNKRIPGENARFQQLLAEADFHILPTRYEAIGVAYCEASAYAVPSLATDTGGVASHVEDGMNGYRLPVEAGGSAYAERIEAIWSDAPGYEALRRNTRLKYDRDLNWTVWAERMESIWERARKGEGK